MPVGDGVGIFVVCSVVAAFVWRFPGVWSAAARFNIGLKKQPPPNRWLAAALPFVFGLAILVLAIVGRS